MRTISDWILIVEDDEDDRLIINQAFESVCPDLARVFAVDGEEAQLFIQAPPFPLFVLSDLNMPRRNGLELLQQFRLQSVFKTIPFVIFTTSSSEEDRDKCYHAGANAFVYKPVQFGHLTNLVQSLVNLWGPKD
ncbi:response regulator [Spirosoma sp. KNUC1025]|uniref:response regulator n=1 Tax=Spirosoma sp. KNUC1025 TaxID=2894082 RepID=UPI001E4B0B17|nr:response regulator [Spirosoma sp. KNUC1025]UFH57665.1 response regulator [Spirosoma sp. KNUC1025]